MKKLLAIILALVLVVSVTACGGKSNENETDVPKDTVQTEDEATKEENVAADKQADKTEDKETTKKPEDVQTQKPATKPETQQKPAAKPDTHQKPAEKPQIQEKPEQKPTEKPAETPVPEATTLGKTLLADFKAKAASGMGIQEIAEGLLANPAIKFVGGAMPVEEGLLSGFDNAEIRGFKNGVMFAPMIGSIPFVGYVFELENSAGVSAFIANLEKNANRRWNICVEADETVTGSAGNKVFFVMCPNTLEE